MEDEDVKDDLAQLCRFFSRNTGEDLVSLEQYIADMKVIFFVSRPPCLLVPVVLLKGPLSIFVCGMIHAFCMILA